jgi:ankyrin repeat protein
MVTLLDAAEEGLIGEVRRLLDAGMDVNEVSADGRTPLLAALSEGAVECAVLLLERGAKRQVDSKGLGPLHHAVGSGQRAAMLFALDLEPNINARDKDGFTPLAWAALLGDDTALEFLLEHGGDPNRADIGEWTPLHLAAAKGNAAIIKRLLDAGADLRKLPSGDSPLDIAMIYAEGSEACLLLAAAEAARELT